MKRWIPTRERLLASRWLRPVAHHIDKPHLWNTSRRSVSAAVAIGLFFGLLIPLGQFLAAIAVAAYFRVHIAIAAAATIISNPLTLPPLYWLGYRIGSALLGDPAADSTALQVEAETKTVLAQRGFLEALWAPIQSAGAPLILGMAVMAVVAAVVGYAVTWMLWRGRSEDDGVEPAETPRLKGD